MLMAKPILQLLYTTTSYILDYLTSEYFVTTSEWNTTTKATSYFTLEKLLKSKEKTGYHSQVFVCTNRKGVYIAIL